MDKKIVKRYVAFKLAMQDQALAEARKTMSSDNFLEVVMRQMVSAYPSKVVRFCQEKIMQRYHLKPHKHLFKNPSIAQFISEITGEYTTQDIMMFFRQETGLSVNYLAQATIGGQVITRPALIWMIECLEAATGRQLTMLDSDAPLAYLGDSITLFEIAKYFAETSPTISRLRRRYCSNSDSGIEDALIRFLPTVIGVYRNNADVPVNMSQEDLLNSKLKSWAPHGFPAGDWDMPISWLEDDLHLTLPVVTRWVTDETTVRDLVNLALEIKRKELERQRL